MQHDKPHSGREEGAATQAEPNAPSDFSTMERVEAPHFYASTIQVFGAANDITLMLGRTHPFMMRAESAQQFGAAIEAQAILHLSPETAKDLLYLLRDQIEKIEATYGEIRTDFTTERDKA